ncbi:MAG: hypothetical protein WC683_16210 [bacterium]
MATPKFDRDRAIRIVVDAVQMGDAQACAFHKVALRTLQSYRKRLAGDPELAQAHAVKKEQDTLEWDAQRRAFLAEGFAKIRELIKNADLKNLRDVVGALKIAGELQVTVDTLHVSPGANQQSPKAAEASGGSGEAAGESAPAVH